MPKGKFRKDFTEKEYAQYLENQVKTDKYEHDGLESWEVKSGAKEGFVRHIHKTKKRMS